LGCKKEVVDLVQLTVEDLTGQEGEPMIGSYEYLIKLGDDEEFEYSRLDRLKDNLLVATVIGTVIGRHFNYEVKELTDFLLVETIIGYHNEGHLLCNKLLISPFAFCEQIIVIQNLF
jgi:hypothetical protein